MRMTAAILDMTAVILDTMVVETALMEGVTLTEGEIVTLTAVEVWPEEITVQ